MLAHKKWAKLPTNTKEFHQTLEVITSNNILTIQILLLFTEVYFIIDKCTYLYNFFWFLECKMTMVMQTVKMLTSHDPLVQYRRWHNTP